MSEQASNSSSSDTRCALSTGDKALDNLLDMDGDGAGIPIPPDVPIVLVEGQAGTGKTTLALQMATRAATLEWSVFYCGLEQSNESLQRVARSYGFEPALYDLSSDPSPNPKPVSHSVTLFQLSPRPIRDAEPSAFFEARLAELRHVVSVAGQEATAAVPPKKLVFFIDSLTGFSDRPLERGQIHRLFSVFRSSPDCACAVFTMERHSGAASDVAEACDCAVFLSDVVIRLSRETPVGHVHHFVEIVKSRVARAALGKHLFKFRSREEGERAGLVVYRSIHYVLSSARTAETRAAPPSPKTSMLVVDSTKEADLGLILNNTEIPCNSRIAIVGPNGTHKLALALNLALARPKQIGKHARALVLVFGTARDLSLEKVAWTQFNAALGAKWRTVAAPQGNPKKYWRADRSSEHERLVAVSLVAFRIGQLTPEECFDTVETAIHEGRKARRRYTSVVVCNTAEIFTGFPALAREPLFLPCLIDLFSTEQLMSVGIGVREDAETGSRQANAALLAQADYRLLLNHYPSVEKVAAGMVGLETQPQKLQEQLVTVVVDNVSGRHYGRQVRWLTVLPDRKTLSCTDKLVTST